MSQLWRSRGMSLLLTLVLALMLALGISPVQMDLIRVAQAQTQKNAAQQLIDEGMELFNQGSKESVERALVKLAEAIRVSQAAGDKTRMALALLWSGGLSEDLSNKQQAIAFYERSLPLYRELGDRSGEANTLKKIGSVYSDLREQQKALEYLVQSLSLWREVGDRSGEATTLNDIGHVYSSLGEQQKALEYYAQSLHLWRKVGNRSGEAGTLATIGGVSSSLGEQQKALEYYAQSLHLWRAVSDRSGEARTLATIGGVYFGLGELQKALEYYAQSLHLFRAVGNRFGEAGTLNQIGHVYSSLGEKQKALEYYSQSLPLARAMPHRFSEAVTLTSIGLVYSDLGEKQKALEYLAQSLILCRKVSDRSLEATIFTGIGEVYDDLGELQKALEYYAQSLSLWRAVGDRSGEARTLTSIGSVYYFLGELQKALEYYSQSLPLSRGMGDRSSEANTLGNIGAVYSALGEKEKALGFYNQALPLIRSVGNRSGEAATLTGIGGVYSALGEKEKALGFYNQALPLWRAVGDRDGEAHTLRATARVHQDQNKLTEALTQINTAITLIEQLRSALKDDQLKTSYFATVQSYYQFKIDLLMQLHQQDPTKGYDAQALETSDQSRARVLRDLLTEARANITNNISPKLKQREDDLIQKLNTREKQLIELSSKPNTDQQIEQLKTEIQQLLQQQQTLKTEIRQTNPAYANLQYPKPIALAEIQQQLTPDTLLLQYQLGKDKSYLWVVGKTSFTSYKLPKRSDLETAVQAFRTSLLDVNDEYNMGILARSLSQQLLGPAASQLGQKRLLIVPDGILHKIPFAVLSKPNSKEYNPLLETHEISYLPAASLITLQYPNRTPAPKTIAILADPIFNLNDDRLIQKTSSTKQLEVTETIARDRAARSLILSRIPGTAVEANDIRQLLSPTESLIVTGFDSTYNWVTTAPLRQYRYLHLATHGIFDEERPELSSLIFSLYNAKAEPQRAFLRLPDLFNLNLPAEMVTLSACQTGLGNSVPGEGLVGMTRGLMYAGAKRVTVSLWSVPDQETAQLMQRFYRNLLDQKGPKMSHSAALRSAQFQMWKQGIHPYYWSAFVMQGEWRN